MSLTRMTIIPNEPAKLIMSRLLVSPPDNAQTIIEPIDTAMHVAIMA